MTDPDPHLIDVPEPDGVTAAWWEATRGRRLLVQHCTACGRAQHPPRAVCSHCGTTDHLEFHPAAGTGSVDSWTVVHRAPRPNLATPYTIVRVRLAEGPIMLSRLESGPDDPEPELGTRVVVGWVELVDGRALPTFRIDHAP